MRRPLHLRWLRVKRHLRTLGDNEGRRARLRAARGFALLAAGTDAARGRLCRVPARLAA